MAEEFAETIDTYGWLHTGDLAGAHDHLGWDTAA